MSTVLLATGRIVVPYTINGLLHKHHAYVRNPQFVGGAWTINSRTTDSNDTLWTAALEGLITGFNGVFPSDVTVGLCLFQTLEGPVWVTQDSATQSITPTGTAHVPASQITITVKDKSFKNVKIVLMECIETPPFKISAATGGDSAFDALTSRYIGHNASHAWPYDWQVGRGNQYFMASPFVSAVVTYNRKLRRARGLA